MFNGLFQFTVEAIEVAGVLILAAGLVWASSIYMRALPATRSTDERRRAFRHYRANIGRSILLGLEFLVAADIIKTVTMELTFESVAILGAVVLVRTFLSFALLVEIEGRWPWRNERAQEGEGL